MEEGTEEGVVDAQTEKRRAAACAVRRQLARRRDHGCPCPHAAHTQLTALTARRQGDAALELEHAAATEKLPAELEQHPHLPKGARRPRARVSKEQHQASGTVTVPLSPPQAKQIFTDS